MTIKKVSIIGAGTMGNGIAQVFAQNGFDVTLVDIKEDFVKKGIGNIRKNLDKAVSKEKITSEEADKVFNRVKGTIDMIDVSESDLVIEAVIEDINVKEDVFRKLDELTRPDTILASNTSSLSIDEISAFTQDPSRVIGMHFMNPAPIMQLVEIVKGAKTSDGTHKAVIELTIELGKKAATVNDHPGFVLNRILIPMINEAAYALQDGVASKENIDKVMKFGANHPMGPLELADLIGLDVCVYIMEVLHDGLKDDKYLPCPLLKKMVEAKSLGRKSGKGFYDY